MRKRIGLFFVLTLGMFLTLAVPGVRGAFENAGVFRVDSVSVEGAVHLEERALVALAAVDPEASVWDDLEPIATRVRDYPGIRDVRVRRRLPNRIVLEISEREPVALYPDPVLTLVDAEGQLLPITPVGRSVDLPLLQPTRGAPTNGTRLTPAQLRLLASEVARLRELDPAVLASVSEVALGREGEIVMHLAEPNLVLRYHPPLVPIRLSEALLVLEDTLEREPDRTPILLDLRFADQVVVRFSDSASR